MWSRWRPPFVSVSTCGTVLQCRPEGRRETPGASRCFVDDLPAAPNSQPGRLEESGFADQRAGATWSFAASGRGVEHDLRAIVRFVVPHPVGLGRAGERQPVAHDERRVDLPGADALEQWAEICGRSARWRRPRRMAPRRGDRRRRRRPTPFRPPAGLDRLQQHVHAVGAEAHRLLDPVVARVEGRSVGLGADRAARQRDTPSFSRV
jgi:hypothetical protein